jgi:single-stranded DNA-binding protein
MTLLKLTFAGKAMKVEHKMAGDKPIIEVSLCRKQKGRGNEPETFCWIRVTIWNAPEFMKRIQKGTFISGCGDFSSRSYEGNDGKATALEVRCSGFDVEIDGGEPATDQSARPTQAAPVKPAMGGGASGDVDGPPFMSLGYWG